jgi:hypothetical protein
MLRHVAEARTRRAFTLFSGLLAVMGMAGCDRPPPPEPEPTSQITLALTTVPADVLCVEVTVTMAGAQTITQRFDVTPGGAALITVPGLPSGMATVDERAYAVACSSVQPGITIPVWVAQQPVSVTLAAGQITDVTIVLRRPAQVRINNDFQDSPRLSTSPSPVSFGNATVGSAPIIQTVTVNNTGTVPAVFAAGITGPDASQFAITASTCPAAGAGFPVGGTCTLTLQFAPTTGGAKGATLVLGTPAVLMVPITGNAISIMLTTAPTSLNFGNVVLAAMPPTQNVTVSNTGTASVPFATSLTGMDASQFAVSATTCPTGGASLPAGATCTVTVRFMATALGAKTATLSLGSPAVATVSLAGTVQSPLTVTPSALSFGNVTVGVVSAPTQTVTVNNIGTAAVPFASSVTGTDAAQFVVTANTCPAAGAPLAAGASCAVTLRFAPTSSGIKSAALSLGSPVLASVPLSGTGTLAMLSVSPTTLTFGNVATGSNSTTQVVNVTNTGTAGIPFGSSLTGTDATQFAITANTCPSGGAFLAATASCAVTVRFAPTTAGMKAATLALGQPVVATVTLSGAGVTPTLAVNPSPLTFGNVTVGGMGFTQSVAVSNPTSVGAPFIATVTGIDAGSFMVTGSNCLPTLAAGASCVVNVRFLPASTGAKSATLALGSLASVAMTGTGVAAPVLAVSPAALGFGNVVLGAMGVTQTVNATNTSTATLAFNVVVSGTDAPQFQIASTTCPVGSPINPGATCSVTMRFAPVAPGIRTASLTRGPPPATVVTMNGTGVVTATLNVAPPSLSFGTVGVTPQGPTMVVNVTNPGTAAVPFAANVTGADPSQFVIVTSSCAGTTGSLAAGASCTMQVRFSPSSVGAKSATLSLGAPVVAIVPLSGTGA